MFLPVLFMEGLDFLVLVVELVLVFDLDLHGVVVVDCLCVLFAVY